MRYTAVDQFGLKSNLNLPFNNYAVKTGTSNNFKDSWVIGYTPDFLVGVWLGNPDYSSMDEVSGTMGAGEIWSAVMELLLNSKYNKHSQFDYSSLQEFTFDNNLEYGLKGDDYFNLRYVLLKDESLILSPFNNSRYSLDENSIVFLKAREDVSWFVNNQLITKGRETYFRPSAPGKYKIEASNQKKREFVTIEVVSHD